MTQQNGSPKKKIISLRPKRLPTRSPNCEQTWAERSDAWRETRTISATYSGVHKCQQRRRARDQGEPSLQLKINQRKSAWPRRKQGKRNPTFFFRGKLSSTLKRLEKHRRSGRRPPRNMLKRSQKRPVQIGARPNHGDSGVRMSGTHKLDIPGISLGYRPHAPPVSRQTSGPHHPGPRQSAGNDDGGEVPRLSGTDATDTLARHDDDAGDVLWSQPVQTPYHGDGETEPANNWLSEASTISLRNFRCQQSEARLMATRIWQSEVYRLSSPAVYPLTSYVQLGCEHIAPTGLTPCDMAIPTNAEDLTSWKTLLAHDQDEQEGANDDGFTNTATSGPFRQASPLRLCLDLLRGTQGLTAIDANSTSRSGPALYWKAIADLVARLASQSDTSSQTSDAETATSQATERSSFQRGSRRRRSKARRAKEYVVLMTSILRQIYQRVHRGHRVSQEEFGIAKDLLRNQDTDQDSVCLIARMALLVAPSDGDTEEEPQASIADFATKHQQFLESLIDGHLTADAADEAAKLTDGMLRLLQLRHKRQSKERFMYLPII